MKIALLGGNCYSYANAPSYVHANGRGCITQRELMGDDSYASPATTPQAAYEEVQYYKSRGWEPNPESVALAKQYTGDRVYSTIEKGMTLAEKGIGLVQQITGKSTPTTDPNAGRSGDNTAMIIIGGVAAVAVISVILASKKKSRR